jgi:pimeloyl-ACP methyl ester carboxylesterase
MPVFDVDVTVTDADGADPLAAGSIRRRPVNEGVDVTEVNDGTRVGFLTRPAGARGPLPAVLAFGGSEGGTFYGQFMAYYLAQLGYASFGVAYFGAPGLSPDLERVPLEVLSDDLDYLAAQPGVDPDRIAVLGASRGGELALLLGATFPNRVRAVVAQVPSGYVWGATTGNDVSAWTLGDADVPYVPSSGAPAEYYMRNGNTYAVTTPAFLADIAAAPPAALAAAAIPVASTQGPILLLGGEDDQLWPSCVLADVAWDALTAAGHTGAHADETHCFPEAGHLISFPPGSSTLENTAVYYPEFDVYLVTGGTPQGIARAEREGNTITRAFLEKALGGS